MGQLQRFRGSAAGGLTPQPPSGRAGLSAVSAMTTRRSGSAAWMPRLIRWVAGSEQRGRLVEHDAEHVLDLVEVLLGADQGRGELDDRVAAVVGAAVEALGVQLLGDEAEEQA